MSSKFIVVIKIFFEYFSKMSFVENYEVIKAFSSNCPNYSLNIPVLPRRSLCCYNFFNSNITNFLSKIFAEFAVSISDYILIRVIIIKSISHLLYRPNGSWIFCYIEMNNSYSVIFNHY